MDDLMRRLAELSPERRELVERFLGRDGTDTSLLAVDEDPRSELETALAEIFAEVLGRDRVGRRQSYFALGGDSISSLQVVAKARRRGLALTTRLLFEHPSIDALAAALSAVNASNDSGQIEGGSTDSPPLAGDERAALAALWRAELGTAGGESLSSVIEDIHPLSATQLGMLFEALRQPERGVYVEQTVAAVGGALDVEAFARAFEVVVNRHPQLRSAIWWDGLARPLTLVHRRVEVPVRVVDLEGDPSRLSDLMAEEWRRPLDLRRPPLTRLLIVRQRAELHHLVWTSCHLVIDAWSLGIVLGELLALYQADLGATAVELPAVVPFRRYAEWQAGRDWSELLSQWRGRFVALGGPSPRASKLSAEQPDAPLPALHRQLSAAHTAALRSVASDHGATLGQVAMTAWARALARQRGAEQVRFGLVLSGRSVSVPGIESMVGSLVNTLPFQVSVSTDWSIGLAEVRARHAELLASEHLPLAELRRAVGLGADEELFDSLFVFLNALAAESLPWGDLKLLDTRALGRSSYALTLRVVPSTALELEILFDPDRIPASQASTLLEALATDLERLAAAPPTLVPRHPGEEPVMESPKPSLNLDRLRAIRPHVLSSDPATSTRFRPLLPPSPLPWLVEAGSSDEDLANWLNTHRAELNTRLEREGGVLFRGFALPRLEAFERAADALGQDRLEYRERSTPRTELGNRIYTSTEYPADQEIALHNEFSYGLSWPLRIAFHCLQPAASGGETPIADARQVWQLLPRELRESFANRGVMYVRNFGHGIDLPWREVFQTDDPAEVERYCRESGLSWEWRDGDRLRTRQVRSAIARHPRTGETVWFNQAHLFHPSNLGEEVADQMRELVGEEELPRDARYGDGGVIEPETLAAIRSAYREASVAFPWRQGDVLVLDNMLVAHGRRPFVGERRIVVAMAERYRPAAPETAEG